ncbi:hypothetical protein LTR36_006846 [Oleoguttula mirabilis]|uniref:Uncharacterized protein n=1 Tax=Oleoguttula mirabilis TaxID=1507867 RepID=A0AAV9JBC2_9PEZI|nr:hypothetical protein LTR36_006846 [Oleoguttula mirabilis]
MGTFAYPKKPTMCFKTQYSYVACGCPADKPAAKNLCWVHHCPMSMNHSPFRPCEDLDQSKPTAVKLRGICPGCMMKPKHDPKAKGYQPAFQTYEYQAYKEECLRRRLEDLKYYRCPESKPMPKGKKKDMSTDA